MINTLASYSKTTWTDGYGEPLNANNLNKIESGIVAATDKINQVITDVNGLNSTSGNQSKTIETHTKDIETLKSDHLTQESKITDLNNSMYELNTSIEKCANTDDEVIILNCGSSIKLID